MQSNRVFPSRIRVAAILLGVLLAHPLCNAVNNTPPPQPTTAGKFAEVAATPQTLDAMRQGGLVLYMRHGLTDNSRTDQVPTVDLQDCHTQRPLSEDGRKLAAKVGRSVRAANVQIAELHISPMCRVIDTAAAAFPKLPPTIDRNLMYTANLTDAQKAPILQRTRQLLSDPVASGGNRLVIAHGPNLMDLMGYFPKEATIAVFRPLGSGQFEYIASVAPDAWPLAARSGGLP